MIKVERLLQLSLLVMVCLSGLLIGLSQGDLQLAGIATFGAFLGFLLVDYFGLFRLKGWLANVASILVLVYTMWDFLSGDSAVKLIAVSRLLVYLQTLLIFQRKTPRLIGQVMVLSLLQIVVAAIFNLNFEGGLLFVLYFAVAGITLVLQSTYTLNYRLRDQNRRGAGRIKSLLGVLTAQPLPSRVSGTARPRKPIAMFDAGSCDRGQLVPMLQHLVLWLATALVFSTVMFYMIPRGQTAWFGPAFKKTLQTGATKRVDLEAEGLITLSGNLVMRTWFEKPGTQERVQLQGPVYFRGMALSSLDLKNGKTNWSAPYDRIYPTVYQKPRRAPRELASRLVVQRTSVEPTNDPLIHACMPAFAVSGTNSEVDFCQELSAFTRRRESDKIELAPYKNAFGTILDEDSQMLLSWPFRSDTYIDLQQPMSENPGQQRWLTRIKPENYPNLVRIANEIAQQAESRRDLVNRIRDYFLDPQQFTYTLDYRDVEFDRSIDPIEDFVANHRRGHCELFASALTLMLRSQGIPSRYVVGFYGGEYNNLTRAYMVREKHAHAWVEVYLRPQDCTPEMVQSGAAGPGGAWLLADPTPPSYDTDSSSAEDAIDMARSLWQDYVLGLTESGQQQQSFDLQSINLLGILNLSRWNPGFQRTAELVQNSPALRFLLIAGGLLFVVIVAWRMISQAGRRDRQRKRGPAINPIRRLLGNAISILAPGLGKWVRGEFDVFPGTEFYHRMSASLKSIGLTREPSQTHREFAGEVAGQLAAAAPGLSPETAGLANQVGAIVDDLTETFYQVRFGGSSLDKPRQQEIERNLQKLEQVLTGFPKAARNSNQA